MATACFDLVGALGATACLGAFGIDLEEVELELLEDLCSDFTVFFADLPWRSAAIQPDTETPKRLGHLCWCAEKAKHLMLTTAVLLLHQQPTIAPATR